jgi:RNA polymerase sigma-70 factor (ECF subfamily)
MTALSSPLVDADGDLVSQAAAGDEAAFTRIVAAHHDDMLRVSFVVCGDAHLAEEAVAAAWVIAWRKLGDLREPARLRPWLVSIAVNEARQVVRRRRRDRGHGVLELAVADADVDAAADDPTARATDIDLVNALARLDPEDRALLALRYVAGFDATELARATGRSPSGTRARLARLLDRLRTELRDD